jgi:Uma2 family endonuclease
VVSGYKVRITHSHGVMPDLQFYRAGNDPRSQQAGLAEGHPDLVVEVSSPTSVRYDRVKKLTWYASIGTPEYWIIDPMQRTFERLLLEGERYAIAEVADGDDVVRPATFEALEIPLAELWESVERPQ